VGPGSGVYLPALCELADEVVASDIEQEFLSNASAMEEQHKNLSCLTDDITNSLLEVGTFDLILCTEVIEHLIDSKEALKTLSSLLADNGVLILTTPQRLSTLELCAKIAFLPGIIQLVKFIYREPIIETGHINLLTESELKEQLEAANLAVHTSFKCGMYLPLIAEFGGAAGLGLLKYMERSIRGTFFDGLLWTQCYVISRSQ
jgi:2-polyprenyl-3-methyl-5-hydroxy-6-metoxy-1,4-benzoquinol methylase